MELVNINRNLVYQKRVSNFDQGQLKDMLPSWLSNLSTTHCYDCALWIPILKTVLESDCRDNEYLTNVVKSHEETYKVRIADTEVSYFNACRLCYRLDSRKWGNIICEAFLREDDSNEK